MPEWLTSSSGPSLTSLPSPSRQSRSPPDQELVNHLCSELVTPSQLRLLHIMLLAFFSLAVSLPRRSVQTRLFYDSLGHWRLGSSSWRYVRVVVWFAEQYHSRQRNGLSATEGRLSPKYGGLRHAPPTFQFSLVSLWSVPWLCGVLCLLLTKLPPCIPQTPSPITPICAFYTLQPNPLHHLKLALNEDANTKSQLSNPLCIW